MDYIHGRIYKLTSKSSPCFYFGSTIQSLRQRFIEHRNDSKRSNRKLFCEFTFEKFYNNEISIELIEECIVYNEKELREIEKRYIQCEISNVNCLNSNITGLTEEEQRDHNIQSYRKYYNNHKEQRNEKARIKHKEQMLSKIKCECGEEVGKKNLSKHKKTHKHLQLMNLLNNN